MAGGFDEKIQKMPFQFLVRRPLRSKSGDVKVFHQLNRREFFIDNLLVQIHFIIVMIRWTGLAPWELEFPFPRSLTSTFLTGGGGGWDGGDADHRCPVAGVRPPTVERALLFFFFFIHDDKVDSDQ